MPFSKLEEININININIEKDDNFLLHSIPVEVTPAKSRGEETTKTSSPSSSPFGAILKTGCTVVRGPIDSSVTMIKSNSELSISTLLT